MKYISKIAIRQTPLPKLLADAAAFPPLAGKAKTKPGIDASFLRQLKAILFRVAFPSWRSSEAGVVALHSMFLGFGESITADVESWAGSAAGLYGNLLKPSLDILLFTSRLSRSLGFRGTVLLFLNYYATASILKAVTPAFGRLAAVEARLEGEYRAGMGRVGRDGEKQRAMGLARVLYHKPKFATLGEYTSVVLSNVEGKMYEHAQSLRITLITISLRFYHTLLLTLNGGAEGNWTLSRFGTAKERMGIDREIASLEGKPAEVNDWEQRVTDERTGLGGVNNTFPSC
ncbi:hypothetical protein FIBSPDRAFT_947971 [Athelia psychrophila]|uniref:ABC transmembrane type-1 domain-containing protein n=1 Tax=Athelia psychrophila TaxID=1759441 RepID=A0A166RAE7_9AGAM|nr:hypothetical protein FIBSPDRAFT_947971 [Fibularhizoctonia sp. CBS 109695]